jgi:cation diffusion facilitator CzcD-associated flavoprotein CzcO
MEERSGNKGWTVVTENEGKQTRHEFDFCIVAQGIHNAKNDQVHSFLERLWEGIPAFKANGGQVLTRHDNDIDFSKLAGKRVAVVGFGKTALDFCQIACENGAAATYHIFRTARWLVPENLLGLRNSYIVFNRINGEAVPAWGYPSTIQRFLHGHFNGLFVGLWGLIQKAVWFLYSVKVWFKSSEIKQRFNLLRPNHDLLVDHRAEGATCTTHFYDFVASGDLHPMHGEIQKFTEKGVVLKDGTDLAVDVVLPCLGSDVAPTRFSYLPEKYARPMEMDPHGPQLYRHMIHPDIPNVAFMGLNTGYLHCTHIYLGSVWLASFVRGEITLPSATEQRNCMERVKTWKAQNMSTGPTTNCSVNSRVFPYNDTLMKDLGLSPKRKWTPVTEMLMPYTPNDYRGVLAQLQKKRKASGGRLNLTAIDIDM